VSLQRRRFKPGSMIPGTNYRVLRPIGSGAMGAVYEVMHGELDKVFVMKVLHHDLVEHEDPVRRLRRECRLLALLQHPNVVSVTDAGMTHDGIPYFIMERLEGETLYARMRRQSGWRVADVLRLVLEIVEGLVAAHEMGIVHRDIKPSNIFLTNTSGVKLLDFGIAKMLGTDAAVTARGVTLGTPRYMSPEQACGNVAEFRSDLYSLGILMFELIAGTHPFEQAQSPAEMLIAQASWRAPPLPLAKVGGAKDLVGLVAELLSKVPSERPATASCVRERIRSIASELTRGPRAASRYDPISNFLRLRGRLAQRRLPSRLAVTLALALCALSASSVAMLQPIRRVISLGWQPAWGSTVRATLFDHQKSGQRSNRIESPRRPATAAVSARNVEEPPQVETVRIGVPTGQVSQPPAHAERSLAVRRNRKSQGASGTGSSESRPWAVTTSKSENSELIDLTRR
jgi:eukaryotic-like serine/threonine-protein kinase